MPRVLLVFEPPDGGVADSVLTLARGLAGHGWEAEVSGPAGAIVRERIEAAGVAYHPLALRRGYGRPWLDAAALRELAALVRERRPDVVHAHSSKAGVIGRLAAVRTRTPWVFSPHCFAYIGRVSVARKAFAVTVEALLGRAGRGVVLCVAEAERREALRHRSAPADRLAVVHNGAPPCPQAEPDPDVLAFRGDGPLAACVTVLREQKALPDFLAAAVRVLDEVPAARLAIVGDGPEHDALVTRARELGLDGRVGLFGFRPPSSRALQALDVYVLPSAWEAFPIGPLEAMACGLPVVATDVGGTGEAVVDGETGYLVPPGRPDALAERLVELLRDAERRREMGEAGRRRHEESFTVERTVRETAALYDRQLARGR